MAEPSEKLTMLRCPTCKKPVAEPAPGQPMGTFPFCCDRCRLIDLGRWLDGKYQIPVVEDNTDNGEGLDVLCRRDAEPE